MGIDWDSLWGQAQNAVNQGLTDLQNVGVPALQATAEQWAINVLTEQHAQTTQTLNQNVKEVLDRPSEEGSIGGYMAQFFQQPVLQKYGPHILIGVGGMIILGVILARKG